MKLQDFKAQLNPEWRYNIITTDGNSLFQGIDSGKPDKVLSLDFLNSLDASKGYLISVFAPNGTRPLKKENTVIKRWKLKETITIEPEGQQQMAGMPTAPNAATTTAAVPKGLSGLDMVFSVPQTASFLYQNLKEEKEKTEAKLEETQKALEAAKEKLREYELSEIEHRQEVSRLNGTISDKESEIVKARGWSDKISSFMEMASQNPEGTQVMLNGIIGGVKNNFFGGESPKALSGPGGEQLNQIKKFIESSSANVTNAMMQVVTVLATSSQGDEQTYMTNAQMIIEMLGGQNPNK